MAAPSSSTFTGWWDNREDATLEYYYRGDKVGHITASGSFVTTGGLTSSAPTGIGIGYASGAGSSVTQAGSKTSAVTINTLCGVITGAASSLSATTELSYTVSNSQVSLSDVVVASVVSGMTAVSAHVTTVAAGSFEITLYNMSAAAAAAVLVNFAVIKSAIT